MLLWFFQYINYKQLLTHDPLCLLVQCMKAVLWSSSGSLAHAGMMWLWLSPGCFQVYLTENRERVSLKIDQTQYLYISCQCSLSWHTRWVMQLMQYGCRNEKQDVPPLTPAALADSVSCLYRPQYIWMSWLKRHSRQGCRPDLHQISSTSFLSTLFHLFGVPKPCHRRKPLSSCLGTCIKQNGGAIMLCLWSASGGSNRAWWMEWTCVKG